MSAITANDLQELAELSLPTQQYYPHPISLTSNGTEIVLSKPRIQQWQVKDTAELWNYWNPQPLYILVGLEGNDL